MKKKQPVHRNKVFGTFTIDRDILRALRQQAKREGENQSLIVRRLLRQYLESTGALPPSRFVATDDSIIVRRPR